MAKILLVEDNDMNRDMLSRRLAKREHTVVIAKDGKAGIDIALFEKPDVILMDLSLPEVDGWEATRRLKAHHDTMHIPIIALTAHAMAGDREKAIASGADDFDTKPVDFKKLLRKIESLLQTES